MSMPLFTGHFGTYDFTFTLAQPLAALVVMAVTAINYLNVRTGGAIQVLLTSLKMGTIVAHCRRRLSLRKAQWAGSRASGRAVGPGNTWGPSAPC